ncbi:hypothetical protein HDU67_009654 [Dinochytrium kinnereticum]|nr:hypothetical protein HDU67_009654 [Dinochytrium kinnereticum]
MDEMSATFELHEGDLIKEYRRRGLFDAQRKLLLEDFQRSDYHTDFVKELNGVLEDERANSNEELQFRSLMASVEKYYAFSNVHARLLTTFLFSRKMFPKLLDFLSSSAFLKSETVTSRIQSGMKETADKLIEQKSAGGERKKSEEGDGRSMKGRLDQDDVRMSPDKRSTGSQDRLIGKMAQSSHSSPPPPGSYGGDQSDMEISEDEEHIGKEATPESISAEPSRPSITDNLKTIKGSKDDAAESVKKSSTPHSSSRSGTIELGDEKTAGNDPMEMTPSVNDKDRPESRQRTRGEASQNIKKFDGSRMEVDLEDGAVMTSESNSSRPTRKERLIKPERTRVDPKAFTRNEKAQKLSSTDQKIDTSSETPTTESMPFRSNARKREKEGTPEDLEQEANKRRTSRRSSRGIVSTSEAAGGPEEMVAAEVTPKTPLAPGDVAAAFVMVDSHLRCYQVKVKEFKEESQIYTVEDLEPDLSETDVHAMWELQSNMLFRFRYAPKTLKTGDRCFALYRESPGSQPLTEFYMATVIKIHKNGTVHLRYMDGDEAPALRIDEILLVSPSRVDLYLGAERTHAMLTKEESEESLDRSDEYVKDDEKVPMRHGLRIPKSHRSKRLSERKNEPAEEVVQDAKKESGRSRRLSERKKEPTKEFLESVTTKAKQNIPSESRAIITIEWKAISLLRSLT